MWISKSVKLWSFDVQLIVSSFVIVFLFLFYGIISSSCVEYSKSAYGVESR